MLSVTQLIRRFLAALAALAAVLPATSLAGHTLFTQLVFQELLPTGQDRLNEPVSVGIPLPPYLELEDEKAIVLVGSKRAQFSVSSRWPNGAIRWLQIDALVDIPSTTKILGLQLTTGQAIDAGSLIASESDRMYLLDSGVIQLRWDKHTPVLQGLQLRGNPIETTPWDLTGNTTKQSLPWESSLRQNGPVKATITWQQATPEGHRFVVVRIRREQAWFEVEFGDMVSIDPTKPVSRPAWPLNIPLDEPLGPDTHESDNHLHLLRTQIDGSPLILGTTEPIEGMPHQIMPSTDQAPGSLRRSRLTVHADPQANTSLLLTSPIVGRAASVEVYNDSPVLRHKIMARLNTSPPPDRHEPTSDGLDQASRSLYEFLRATGEGFVDAFPTIGQDLKTAWQSGFSREHPPTEATRTFAGMSDDTLLIATLDQWHESFIKGLTASPPTSPRAATIETLAHWHDPNNTSEVSPLLWKKLDAWLISGTKGDQAALTRTLEAEPELVIVLSQIVEQQTFPKPQQEQLQDLLERVLRAIPAEARDARWYFEAYRQSGDPAILQAGQRYLDRFPHQAFENLQHLIASPLRYRIWRPLPVEISTQENTIQIAWTTPARTERYRFKQAKGPIAVSLLNEVPGQLSFNEAKPLPYDQAPRKSRTPVTASWPGSEGTSIAGRYLERGSALPAPSWEESNASEDLPQPDPGRSITSSQLLQVAVLIFIVGGILMGLKNKFIGATRLLLSLILVVSGAACRPSSQEPVNDEPEQATMPRDAITASGAYRVSYHPTPDPLPLNEHFRLDLTIKPVAEATPDFEIEVGADMPAHGHGINTAPNITTTDRGSYQVEGMLFHMKGDWEIYVDVITGPVRDRATFPITLK